MTKIEKPLLRGHFHQAMFFISLGACSLLILKSSNQIQFLSTLVFTLGTLTMLGISALYHRIQWNPAQRTLMRKLDHSGIYLMIASTFTPVCLLALPEASGFKLLMLIWIVAILGILQSVFFIHLPKWIASIIYIGMGYLVVPYFSELLPRMGAHRNFLMFAGGAAYTLGALCYAFKRPVLNPKVFSYHEVFHLLVCLGVIFHFLMVDSLLAI